MTWSPFLTRGHARADIDDDAGAFVAEDSRKQTLGVGARSVNSSVWQMPVALISTSTSPARGPSSATVVDLERFARRIGHGGANFHAMPRLNFRDTTPGETNGKREPAAPQLELIFYGPCDG